MITPVSFELSKLLKEKGFESKSHIAEYWNVEGEQLLVETWEDEYDSFHHEDCPDDITFVCLAPTISEVVCWIYSKYQIWVQVSILKDDEWHYSIRRKDNNWNIEFPTKEKYTSMENAYEKGINVVLNTYKPKS